MQTTETTSTLRRGINFLGEQGFIVIFVAWLIYLSLSTENFASVDNAFIVLRQSAVIAIVAIGAHFIILLGDIDLSLASNLSLSGVILGYLMVNENTPALWAALAAFGVGALIGLINGLIITRLKINSIITTLGTSSVVAGIALLITESKSIRSDNLDVIKFLSRDTLVSEKIAIVPVLILFGFYLVAYVILRYSTYGARVFAVGNNQRAAWLAGISVDNIKVATYILAGLLAAFGGIMQVARQGSATSSMGDQFLFPILTAVVLGGASLTGGRGKIINTLLAAIFLTTIPSGMVQLGVDIKAQEVVSGGILIAALSLDRLRTLRI